MESLPVCKYPGCPETTKRKPQFCDTHFLQGYGRLSTMKVPEAAKVTKITKERKPMASTENLMTLLERELHDLEVHYNSVTSIFTIKKGSGMVLLPLVALQTSGVKPAAALIRQALATPVIEGVKVEKPISAVAIAEVNPHSPDEDIINRQ